MKRSSEYNINTPVYWDGVFKTESQANRQRVDPARLEVLAWWIREREKELQRWVTLLDIGCGLGDVEAHIFPRMGVRVHGMDISETAIEACRVKFAEAQGVAPAESRYRVASAEEALPYLDEQFDLIWCGETIEHVVDPDALMLEMRRVIGENGFIVCSTPYRGRNQSPEHVHEFEPADVWRWAQKCGELVHFNCNVVESWASMFFVIRRKIRSEIT